MAPGLSRREREVLILASVALVAAIVTYGLLSSTGAFQNNMWNPGGAIVGFLAALFGLNRVYGTPEEAVEGQQQDRNPQGDGDVRLLWLGFADDVDLGQVGLATATCTSAELSICVRRPHNPATCWFTVGHSAGVGVGSWEI